jgi:hypothetical protein
MKNDKLQRRGLLLLSISLLLVITLFVPSCTVSKPVTQPDGSVKEVHSVDPRLSTAIDTGRAVNAATAPMNPYSPLVEIGLGLTAALAGWVAKRKNDKAAANELLAKTLVQAINNLDDDKAEIVKPAIKDHAVSLGVEGDLSQFVKRVESGSI